MAEENEESSTETEVKKIQNVQVKQKLGLEVQKP
jgi:hypothetical protein